jgi:lipoprotein signal peptidase
MTVLLVAVATTLLLDRATKMLAMLEDGEVRVWRPSVVRRVESARTTADRRARVLVGLTAAVSTLVLSSVVPALASGVVQAGFGLAIGGAAGNLVDWLSEGAVVDFVDLGRWPVFNVADGAMVVGIAMILWSALA